jgi:hypothetical protein
MSSKKPEHSENQDSSSPNPPSPPQLNPTVPQFTIADEAIQLGLLDIVPDQPAGKLAKKKQKKRAPGNIERVNTRDELESGIVEKGGDDICVRNASGTIYRTAFGGTAREVYQSAGAVEGDRDTLPAQHQRKLQLHELLVAAGLRNAVVIGIEQSDINNQILQIVKGESTALERYLKSRRLFQEVVISPRAQLGESEASSRIIDIEPN